MYVISVNTSVNELYNPAVNELMMAIEIKFLVSSILSNFCFFSLTSFLFKSPDHPDAKMFVLSENTFGKNLVKIQHHIFSRIFKGKICNTMISILIIAFLEFLWYAFSIGGEFYLLLSIANRKMNNEASGNFNFDSFSFLV